MATIQFYKYSASGNDFIMIDNREEKVDFSKEQIINLCKRREGIGADGIVYLLPSSDCDFRLRIFNADASEAEMCGNATRAITHFAFNYLKLKNEKKFSFTTMNGKYDSEILDNGEIKVRMTELYDVDEVKINDLIYNQNALYLNTGVPHSVYHLATIDSFDFETMALKVRHDNRFKNGTNVDFFAVTNKDKKQITLRVFERGVEAETLCCGTGVMACAVACNKFFGWTGEVEVVTKGGIIKAVVDEALENLYIQGQVKMIYQGQMDV